MASNYSATETGLCYLPLENDQIRLLQIDSLTGSPDGELNCHLGTFPLSSQTEYIALSHPWGGPSRHVIRVNGIPFHVRKTLWRFLRQARALRMPSLFWIDAVCIHQADNLERTSQVGLMPKIYRTASKVLAWLGPAHSGSDDAMRELARHVRWSTKQSSAVLGKPAGIAIQNLCARRFWRRLWIVQELLLAQVVEVICGDKIIPLESMSTFLLAVGSVTPGIRLQEKEAYISIRRSAALSIMQHLSTRSGDGTVQQRTLWNLLLATQSLCCAEPRDKIYALLGVASAGCHDISADYALSISKLLNNVLRNQHRMEIPQDILEVEEQCRQLTSFVSAHYDSLFVLDGRQGRFHLMRPYIPPEWRMNSLSLVWAACYGHEAVAKLLLECGVVSPESARAVSASGNTTAVKLLLETGPEFFDWVPIFDAAARRGQAGVIKLLLDSGPQYLEFNLKMGGVLRAAAAGGHVEVVKILLDGGADVNATLQGSFDIFVAAMSSRDYQQLLHPLADDSAATNVAREAEPTSPLGEGRPEDYERLFRQLLSGDADDNVTEEDECNSALIAAASGGHLQVVSLLLEAGADVNARGGIQGNALTTAALKGHKCVVEMLLSAGADAMGQGGWYHNALQAASCEGHHEIVNLLLDAGADINARGGRHNNALRAASDANHQRVVRVLLERGANVNARGGKLGPALHAASYRGHQGVVKLLLAAGADVNARGGPYQNALQAASRKGNHETVRLLLNSGADVNAQGGTYGNALQAASYKGSVESAKLLLDAGAEVNAVGGFYEDALRAASRGGWYELTKLLLDSGANFHGDAAIHYETIRTATYDGHTGVVNLLLNTTDRQILEEKGRDNIDWKPDWVRHDSFSGPSPTTYDSN